ncbi:DUF3102 domain-containing protein [Acaryochloris sp. CCMEE 5410]|uniref:DUF3102 domain-containing protein n=1 Tax=Acaryochloris sp. CCMEE 5410 TaxID=310037 RepID=UPI0002485077|nr:DUF3102 domain-containing protein [Acaryochloris sp. CCMEE 5410]KAI9129764.1 DUF3102 domain-containing protein [Acaryochloris sp. CCMEE 5410]
MSNSLYCSETHKLNQFNYDLLDSDTKEFVERQTSAIKEIYARTLRDAWEAGRLLLEVKEKLEYGQFCRWIASELGLSRSTACNQMHLAQNFSCATVAQLALPITACYELARASTPSSARNEVIERSKAGEKITKVKTRQIIARHKSQINEEATRQQSLSEANPSKATIDVGCTDVTDRYPDNVVHFRSKSHNQSKPSSGTFHAICLFTSLNSLSLQIMKFAKDGRKSC